MKQVRERYNARARQSCPGSLKKGKRSRHAPTASAETADPNAEILPPKSREQKDKERKERLVQEVSCKSYDVVYLTGVACSAVGEQGIKQEEEETRKIYCETQLFSKCASLMYLSIG